MLGIRKTLGMSVGVDPDNDFEKHSRGFVQLMHTSSALS